MRNNAAHTDAATCMAAGCTVISAARSFRCCRAAAPPLSPFHSALLWTGLLPRAQTRAAAPPPRARQPLPPIPSIPVRRCTRTRRTIARCLLRCALPPATPRCACRTHLLPRHHLPPACHHAPALPRHACLPCPATCFYAPFSVYVIFILLILLLLPALLTPLFTHMQPANSMYA